ncbi:hypothetical protein V6N13_072380 [Hibiscus sabdariffa]|uniref:Uncharacterized protein n=1 Tax=Hibiscus sabdariffa TaxID=183260 RepID=A0ABR2R7Q8_9ROSI
MISDDPSTSRKQLLSDCAKPKTSLSLGHPPLKKTWELPNLTECQACGPRSDNANNKNQIQTLFKSGTLFFFAQNVIFVLTHLKSALIVSKKPLKIVVPVANVSVPFTKHAF